MSPPTKKEVVQALMAFEGREKSTSSSSAYLSYRCPRTGCAKPTVRFCEGSGFSNLYRHLIIRYARGRPEQEQVSILASLYSSARSVSDQNGGSILSHFPVRKLTDYDNAVYGYLHLLIMRSFPIAVVEDHEFRNFSQFKTFLSSKKIVEVILKLVLLVEKRIAKELSSTIGAVMYDGWTANTTHFVSIFAFYCKNIPTQTRSGIVLEPSLQMTLLGLCSLEQVSEDHRLHSQSSSDNSLYTSQHETTLFNAEAHIYYFRETFKIYGPELENWCCCYIADNAQVNYRIASVTKKPQVGCTSQKLNLHVNQLFKDMPDMKKFVNMVHGMMKLAKSRLRNAATLRNSTELKPVLHNDTRWSGKFYMLRRFGEIKTELLKACEDEGIAIPEDYERLFSGKVLR